MKMATLRVTRSGQLIGDINPIALIVDARLMAHSIRLNANGGRATFKIPSSLAAADCQFHALQIVVYDSQY